VNEISGDIAYEHVRWFTHYHRPMGGSEGFEAVARYVEEKAREYGLEDVRYIKLETTTRSWTQKLGELWLIEPEERRLAFTPEVALSLADYSRTTRIDGADLVDVGDGVAEDDYAGRDVKGKVVLASGSLARVMEEAVWKRDALGVVAFSHGRPDHPDQVPWMRIPVENADKSKEGTFAFVLSQRDGLRLRRQLTSLKSGAFRVRARVESIFHDPSWEAIVEAVIRGTEVHDQDIVLTGHLQVEKFSANDDASGFVTRPPASRASALGDVVESIVEALVQGNTGYLAAGQARQTARGGDPSPTTPEETPFSRPIFARLGTRERYDARVVPFHNNTDHQVFNLGIIGIPAVTFTNWPDDYIHSSDDDLWQIDPTQLERNAVAVAAIAWYLATAGEAEQPALAAEVYGRALERLSRDATVAMQMISGLRSVAMPAEHATAYGRARTLVRQSARRERRTIESVRRLAPAPYVVDRLLLQFPSEGEAEARLAGAYAAVTGNSRPPWRISPRERELAARVPRPAATVKAFLEGRPALKRPPGLHPLMAYEALNFVDGKNSYLDIYQAVAAQADAAGEWYYGAVTLDDIVNLLESAEKAGMIRR
jgi:hypothetical protein